MPIGGLPVRLVDEHVRRLYFLATFGDESFTFPEKYDDNIKFDADGVAVQVNSSEMTTNHGMQRFHVERN